jgi:hypothetical protein
MYFDNLTIAGITVATVTALLPLLFGREALRVAEEPGSDGRADRPGSARPSADIDCAAQAELCG